MIILAIDPGLKPGAVVLNDAGTVIRASHRLHDIPGWRQYLLGGGVEWPVVATEGQWYFGKRKQERGGRGSGAPDVNDLLKLAFRAGYTLRDIPAVRRLRIPPQVWRGGTTVDKATMQRRILTTLSLAEKRLFATIPENRHGDCIDAIGIGRCAVTLGSDTTHDWK